MLHGGGCGRGFYASRPNLDAELIGLCEQMIELERQYEAAGVYDEVGPTPRQLAADADQAHIEALQHPVAERIAELPTHTLEGLRARARAIAYWDHGEIEKGESHLGMLWPLLRDLGAEGQG